MALHETEDAASHASSLWGNSSGEVNRPPWHRVRPSIGKGELRMQKKQDKNKEDPSMNNSLKVSITEAKSSKSTTA